MDSHRVGWSLSRNHHPLACMQLYEASRGPHEHQMAETAPREEAQAD